MAAAGLDCPESSELEDDTEGLSTRLSGTLSFTSLEEEEEEEEEEEDEGAAEELGEPPQPPGQAAGAEDGGRCWGAGTAPLLRGPGNGGVAFPRKRLRRNFTAETIAKRSRAFEQFLSHLHSIAEIRRSPEFLEFFFLQDLQAAQRLTCTGMYREALATWANAYRLQDRLGVCSTGRFLLTLAGLAVCHQELEQAPLSPGSSRGTRQEKREGGHVPWQRFPTL
nr:sorting nexin-21 [Columba livia]